MKILQITKKHPYGGGSGKIAADLHEGYLNAGHFPVLAVAEPSTIIPHIILSKGTSSSFLDEIVAPRVKFFLILFLKRSGLRTFKNLREWQARFTPKMDCLTKSFSEWRGIEYFGYRGIWDWIKSQTVYPDIIQGHTLEGDYFDLRSLSELSRKSKVVLTLHNGWMLTGLCHHWLGCEKWKTGCGHCPVIHEHPQFGRDGSRENWKIKKEIYSKSRLYLSTPCQWLMDHVDQSILQTAIVARKVIYNGIDEVIFLPADRFLIRQKLNLPQDSLILLFVGNKTVSNKWKRTDWMFEAIQELSKFVLEKKITFVMLGQEGERSKIGNCDLFMVRHLNDPQQVAEYFQAADIYLHAALMDTFPNVVLEAMGCGLPVVATRVGGISEQVLHGVNGFLSEPGNAKEMAGYLKQLIESESLRMTMGLASRKRVEDHFTKRKMVESYLKWFEEISGKARANGQ